MKMMNNEIELRCDLETAEQLSIVLRVIVSNLENTLLLDEMTPGKRERVAITHSKLQSLVNELSEAVANAKESNTGTES
jgi:methyltransferase-like protein